MTVVACGLCFIAYVVAHLGEARLALSHTELDFGALSPGSTSEKEVRVSNDGDAILRIEKVAAGCQCTAASIDNTILKPRESTILRVKVTGRNQQVSQTSVLIRSTDRRNPQRVISVTFRDVKLFSMEPFQFDFGRTDRETLPRSADIRLKASDPRHSLQIEELVLACRDPQILSVSYASDATSGAVTLRVTAGANVPSGEIVSAVRICNNDGSFDETVPIYLYVPSRLFQRVDPIVLDSSRTITVKRRNDVEGLRDLKISLSDDIRNCIVVDAEVVQDGVALTFRMSEGEDCSPNGFVELRGTSSTHGSDDLRIPIRVTTL